MCLALALLHQQLVRVNTVDYVTRTLPTHNRSQAVLISTATIALL